SGRGCRISRRGSSSTCTCCATVAAPASSCAGTAGGGGRRSSIRPASAAERGELARELLDPGLQLARVFLQPVDLQPLIQRPVDDLQEVVVRPRLLEVVIEPDLVDGPDGALLVGVAGEDDQRHLDVE